MKKSKKILLYLVFTSCLVPIFYMLYSLVTNTSNEVYTSQMNTTINNEESEQENLQSSSTLLNDINTYLTQNGIDSNCVAIAIYNFDTLQHYEQNATINFTSASLYKVPLAMLYYDYIKQGTMQLEDTLLYGETCYEEGGPIGEIYQVGDLITLEELLYDVIVYSDNTAGHILFEHLGGWQSYRLQIQAYSSTPLDSNALNYNEFSATFGNDVMIYMYEHATIYRDLIAHLKLVMPYDYLNKNLGTTIAQKYGSYGDVQNAMGIVYGTHPYALTITTTLGASGTQVIGDINEIIYNEFNTNAS